MELIDVANEVRKHLGLLEIMRDLLNRSFDLLQFLLIELLSLNLLPMHLTPVLLFFLLLLALKLTHTQMRTHDLNPLQLPSNHRRITTADIIILKLHPLLA